MAGQFRKDLERKGIGRREFLRLASTVTAGAIMAPLLGGCAVNPVTGQSQLMLMSEQQEVALDQQHSPHQFSADYGPVQDTALNNYVDSVGQKLARVSHRPNMPYSYRTVNATYVNAYAFPGGSIAATRGILLELQNEAELAALLGHETGHVNARHTASRMSKGILLSAVMAGATAYATSQAGSGWQPLIAGLGSLSTGALLAYYSREDERQADDLGMEYSTRAGLNPEGMIGLQQILVNKSKSQPTLLEQMFATHPMSQERYETAVAAAHNKYKDYNGLPLNRDRFMDHTARLRRMREPIEEMQKGMELMAKKEPDKAEGLYGKALNVAPHDYAGLLMMADCQTALDKPRKAEYYAGRASEVYPQEARAYHSLGVARLMNEKYDAAYQAFARYDQVLPGNPQLLFLKGLSMEGAGQKRKAAEMYYGFLQQVNQGDHAQYAYGRLKQWGVL
jgi:predicted Zn-dependent protease